MSACSRRDVPRIFEGVAYICCKFSKRDGYIAGGRDPKRSRNIKGLKIKVIIKLINVIIKLIKLNYP